VDHSKANALVNGVSPSQRVDSKYGFTDPPAPPPQQPLPEKPDVSRAVITDLPLSPGPLSRSETEKPGLASMLAKADSPQSVLAMVEALNSARKELESTSARVKDLEIMLQKERSARESAEERAMRLELSNSGRVSHHLTGEEAFEASAEAGERHVNGDLDMLSAEEQADDKQEAQEEAAAAEAADAATTRLHNKLEQMVDEMNEMKLLMERYKRRVEVAEDDATTSRNTLAEMVEKIRQEDAKCATNEQALGDGNGGSKELSELGGNASNSSNSGIDTDSSKALAANGSHVGKDLSVKTPSLAAAYQRGQLAQAGPYASMLGVIIIGVGIMSMLNGWNKAEKP
jgi:hypothetical protein